ncbi:MAG: sigma-54-dependent Fis family transcriptional regulator [Gemmatimonadetes bacterium]|nr:sigma-54-dependent Fis family transcriptional regulator [Gemmatimonadota bacterium]
MPPPVPSILLIDDEPSLLESLSILFGRRGYRVDTAQSGRAGIRQLKKERPDVVVSDIKMPEVTGIDVLKAAREVDLFLPVILITARADVDTAVQALNEGAFQYIQKPFENRELLAKVEDALQLRSRMSSLAVPATAKRETVREERPESLPVGQSAAFNEALGMARSVAPTESTVLLQGESGVGKEVFARLLHQLSNRAEGPFVTINCGALPEQLLESELFGHVKGSFTGAIRDKDGMFKVAQGGTFFLDEVGETTLAIQVKLLRVLQEREIIAVGATTPEKVNVRIIAATNKDLEKEVARGTFRQDLFYRLNVIPMLIPALRERREDIPLLMDHFLAKRGMEKGRDRMTKRALDALLAYHWPGNVRELENAMERLMILHPTGKIDFDDLPKKIQQGEPKTLVTDAPPATPTMEILEKAYIKWVLETTDGNKARAAEILGIDTSTLYRKIDRYSL